MVRDNNISSEEQNNKKESLLNGNDPVENVESNESLPLEVMENESVNNAMSGIDESSEDVDDFSLLAAEVSNEVASEALKRVEDSEKNFVDDSSSADDVSLESLAAEVDESSKLDDFLMDIGITRKQFFIFLAIIVFFVAGIVVSFVFLVSLFSDDPDVIDFKNDPKVDEPTVVVEDKSGFFDRLSEWFAGDKQEDDKEDDVVKTDDKVNTGIDLNSQIGNEKPVKISYESIELLNLVGESEKVENKLSDYIRSYRELRAVFNTDLYSYLSVVNDREAAFNDYLTKFKGTFQKFEIDRLELESEIAELKLRSAASDANLEGIQSLFFAEVDALNSEVVPDLLTAFQEAARKNVILTSELKARQAILDRYNNADGKVVDKIRAIELNKDAFVKGVQVVDYKSIDLDLIVGEN